MEKIKQLLEQLGFKDDNGVYLPTLSEFVKTMRKSDGVTFVHTAIRYVDGYTNFITQPLTKGMFLPCDEEGNVLEFKISQYPNIENYEKYKIYKQALERVLFDYETHKPKGDYLVEIWQRIRTIEQAINNGVKLYLK